ncbi:MAG: DUF2061 domain-containing protein [Alphaproteobacteria bacterium]
MRPFVKTLSYAVMHLTVAIAVAYALTGDWAIALGVGIIEPLVQTVAYSLHEKLWSPRRNEPTATGSAAPPLAA